jgi:hypothetical protein
MKKLVAGFAYLIVVYLQLANDADIVVVVGLDDVVSDFLVLVCKH